MKYFIDRWLFTIVLRLAFTIGALETAVIVSSEFQQYSSAGGGVLSITFLNRVFFCEFLETRKS